MKQLLIVKTGTTVNSHVSDFSAIEDGELGIFDLATGAALTAPPTANFGLYLGRPNGQAPFVFSEVDYKTLKVVKTLPLGGVKYQATFTMPTTVVGKEYTLRFFKKATVPHERNSWTVSIVAKTTTAATEAGNLVNAINAKTSNDFKITASASTSGSTTTVTITASDYTDWEVKAVDDLSVTITQTTAEKPIGDKAYVEELASKCAAGKGFNDTYANGPTTIPGYPEAVENLIPDRSGSDGVSTAGYVIYTLRFQVGRESAKTRDEKVWQLVHIAAPLSFASTIDAILPAGEMATNATNAAAATIAATTVTTMVKDTALNA